MLYLQLYQVKKHLNINEEWHDDDEYLCDLIDVAQNIVQTHIDVELQQLENGDGELPPPLIQAMLLLIGNFYANRESVVFAGATPLPHAFEYIIALYKNYNGPTEGTTTI